MSIFSLPVDKLTIFKRGNNRKASFETQRPKFIIRTKSRGISCNQVQNLPSYSKGVKKSIKLQPSAFFTQNFRLIDQSTLINPSKLSDFPKISKGKKKILPRLKNSRYKSPYHIIEETDEENYEEPPKYLTPEPKKRYQSIFTL